MTTILRTTEIILNDDGSVRAVRAHYEDVDATGRSVPLGTRRLDAGALAAALPDRAALLAEIDRLTADLASRDNSSTEAAGEPSAGQ